eukprot:TRINITY_DN12855_c0_g1_i1.p1 TRINITY_DN12855_c0_g1~~TRINITY_DN12855_c0_g1_i1.p1  ORF type:complete len:438 (+),score=67.09 TRINITY_DN12855_c0_g1_i1:56-1369(+)
MEGHLPQDRPLSSYTVITDLERACPHLGKSVRSLLDNSSDNNNKTDDQILREDRCLGSLVAMVVGDAFGAPLEFSAYIPEPLPDQLLTDFSQTDYWENPRLNRFMLKPGQWTDDASMGLALGESLVGRHKFEPLDLRCRFHKWWSAGYCNAFSKETPARASVGLGGNISASLREFERSQFTSEYPVGEDEFSSGNGSIMRLAAVPIFYHRHLSSVVEYARNQSRTTHRGPEAHGAAELMSLIIALAITNKERDPQKLKDYLFENGRLLTELKRVKEELQKTQGGATILYPIECLANSKKEERHESNKTKELDDRDWNWKNVNFRFAPERARGSPGYIGSYSMDALAMALHCVYTTTDLKGAIIKAANFRGDSDSVASVTGQIAGAIYGFEEIPRNWVKAVLQWDIEVGTSHRIILLGKLLASALEPTPCDTPANSVD